MSVVLDPLLLPEIRSISDRVAHNHDQIHTPDPTSPAEQAAHRDPYSSNSRDPTHIDKGCGFMTTKAFSCLGMT